MGPPTKKTDQKYTYGDYYTWNDGERWELIDGEVYSMSPAPLRIHQKILTMLTSRFYTFFEDKTCEVYVAPFDVRLPKGDEADEKIDTVVQPDLSVICDTSKLDRRGCKGAPDLIVEIVSPGNSAHDMKRKLSLYEKHNVKEYWIVLPVYQTTQVYRLNDAGAYGRSDVYGRDETIKTELFPGLEIELAKIFVSEEESEAI